MSMCLEIYDSSKLKKKQKDNYEAESHLLSMFKKNKDKFLGWTLFEQPTINGGKRPDLILTHEEKGIIIMEAKDSDLGKYVYATNGFVKVKGGKYEKACPITQVKGYKNALYKSTIFDEIRNKHENVGYGVIETVVYYNYSTQEQAMNFIGKGYDGHTKIWDKSILEFIVGDGDLSDDGKYTHALSPKKSDFSKDELLQNAVRKLDVELKKCYDVRSDNYEK